MCLSSLKQATYKLKNNDYEVLAAAWRSRPTQKDHELGLGVTWVVHVTGVSFASGMHNEATKPCSMTAYVMARECK